MFVSAASGGHSAPVTRWYTGFIKTPIPHGPNARKRPLSAFRGRPFERDNLEYIAYTAIPAMEDDTEILPILSYLFVAEFDIDQGSCLKECYPPGVRYESKLAELMLPEGVHKRQEDWTFFFLNRDAFCSDQSGKDSMKAPSPLLSCVSAVHNVKDDSVKRGAQVTALAFCTPYNCLNMFKPIALLALERYIHDPTTKTLADIFGLINSCMEMERVPRLNMYEKMLLYRTENEEEKYYTFQLQWPVSSGDLAVHIPLRFPMYLQRGMIDWSNALLVPFLSLFGERSMIIFNAILLEKRVIFVGNPAISAARVCQMVLAACSMLSPPFPTLLSRAFPYSNLTDLDFLQVEGYIAGVTNPVFASKSEWWDLLCNIESGEVVDSAALQDDHAHPRHVSSAARLSKLLKSEISAIPSISTSDEAFIRRILSMLDHSNVSEQWLHNQFFNYCNQLNSLASSKTRAFFVPETKHSHAFNRELFVAWSNTKMYKEHQTREKEISNHTPGQKIGIDIRDHVQKFKSREHMESHDIVRALDELSKVLKSAKDFAIFMYFLDNDITCVAVGLLHSHEVVRSKTFELMLQLEKQPCTKTAMLRLNKFLSLAIASR